MTSLEKAQRFAKSALRIAPLAALAVAANAGLIFDGPGVSGFAHGNIHFQGATAQNTVMTLETLPIQADIIGVKAYGSATYLEGHQQCFDTICGVTAQALLSGAVYGYNLSDPVTIPLHYDFTYSTSSQALTSWNVRFSLLDSDNARLDLFSLSDSTSGHITGTGTATLPTGFQATGYEFAVSTNWYGTNEGDTFSLLVPQNSLDINAIQTASTPEPGTVGLFLSAAGIAFFRRRSYFRR